MTVVEPGPETLEGPPEMHEMPRERAWPLLGRVLVLPRSTFQRLSAEGLTVWPPALGVVALTALVKGALAIALVLRAGSGGTRLLSAVAVRYGAALVGPIVFAALVAGILLYAQRLWQGDAGFSRLLSAVSLALVPLALRNLLQAGYSAVTRAPLLHPGLSALLARVPQSFSGRFGYGVLAQIDAFTLWAFVLLTLAVAVTHGRGWLRSAATLALVVLAWLVVGTLPSMAVAALLTR